MMAPLAGMKKATSFIFKEEMMELEALIYEELLELDDFRNNSMDRQGEIVQGVKEWLSENAMPCWKFTSPTTLEPVDGCFTLDMLHTGYERVLFLSQQPAPVPAENEGVADAF